MVSRYVACDHDRLRRALDGGLAAAAREQLECHLESCPDCRDRLHQLAGGASWMHDVREALATADHLPLDTPPADAAGGGVTPAACDVAESGDSRREAWESILSPPTTPGSLGRLGSYDVTEVVGRGGMGVVLKAFDAALARHVAIKILAAELATSSAARRRFAREAQAAAAVVHDHVVAIHLIDAAAGLPYLVMQHVAGRSLQERLSREGPLELAEVLRIGMQTALGLAAAHSQGLVHLDVKPANILLEYGVERVKLTDFGLARAVDDASQTQSGIVAGTPQYMAPEQAKGDLVDHRADLFSLGSVIYAMCTGHSPFRAGNTLAVLRRVCEDEPRRMRQIRPEIPAWLDALVARLLAKDPAQRFQSAAEVARRLEECLAHVQQPEVYALPAIDDARHSRRTKRIVLSGTAAVAGAAILAAVWGALGFPGFTADGTHRNGTVSDAQSTQGEPAYREASAGAIDMAVAWDNLAAPLAEIASTVERLRYELTGPRAAPAAPLDLMIADVTQALDSLQHEIERSSLTDSMRDRSFENVP